MVYVYYFQNLINGKIYIGKTDDFYKRIKEHISLSKTGKKIFSIHRAIRKYGISNFEVNIINICDSEVQANEEEKFWISYLKEQNIVLYNLTDGGEGSSGVKWSDESREKIKGPNNHNFGKSLKEETKQKISKNNGKGFLGKNHSDKSKMEMSKNRKNKPAWNKGISFKVQNTDKSEIAEKIRKEYKNNISVDELSKKYKYSIRTIRNILAKKFY